MIRHDRWYPDLIDESGEHMCHLCGWELNRQMERGIHISCRKATHSMGMRSARYEAAVAARQHTNPHYEEAGAKVRALKASFPR